MCGGGEAQSSVGNDDCCLMKEKRLEGEQLLNEHNFGGEERRTTAQPTTQP